MEPLTVAGAVALVPKGSRLRRLLPKLCDRRKATREAAYDKLEVLVPTGDSPYVANWAVDEVEAIARVTIAGRLTFPPQAFDWDVTAHELVFPLVQSPYPSLVAPIVAAYPTAPDRARAGLLSVLGAIATRPAAKAFVACIRQFGWPSSYQRVFVELTKLASFGVFPELLEKAGKYTAEIMDVFVRAVAAKQLDVAKLDLSSLAPMVSRSLASTLTRAEKAQKRDATTIAWRFGERYTRLRIACGTWLDLAGYVDAPGLDAMLSRALRLADPKLVKFAAVSRIRRGKSVAPRILDRIAASHETRAMLWHSLEALGVKFPARYRTWDAFATAEMVEWLAHPSELGCEPDEIEQMAVLATRGQALYVFRFRSGKKPTWYSAICGPFARRGTPKPVYGASTFSRFDPWGNATAEQHAAAILATLSQMS